MGADPEAVYRKTATAYLALRGGTLEHGTVAVPEEFQWSDAWLLLAVKGAQGDAPEAELERILATGDAINHAVFTDDELAGGVARLAGAGWITLRGAACAVSQKFVEAWSAAGGQKFRALHKQLGAVETILDIAPRRALKLRQAG